MAIRCPYCQHGMEVRGAKPGRFTPSCPKCQLRFVLTIPAQAGAAPVVAELALAPDEDQIDARIAAVLGIDDRDESLTGAPVGHGLAEGRPTAATIPPPTPGGVDFDGAAVGADADDAIPHVADNTRPHVTGNAAATSAPAARITQATMPPPAHSATQRYADPAATAAIPEDHNRAAHQLPGASTAGAQGPVVDVVHQTLGGYQLLQRLGQGGMGAVYLARQMSLDRNVAVKVLHPQWAGDAQFVARFTREAYAAAQLVHHNVVQIHDIGAQEQTHFYSMEFVPGQTLAGLVRQHGRLEAEVAVNYILQAARGLKFAHDRGMIHRDIKPENLLLNDEGLVKVADLGLVKTPGSLETLPGKRQSSHAEEHGDEHAGAHTTRHNSAMGTPLYMPPEQAKDAANVDARADIYSLGCTLYALLTAQPPFTGSTAAEVIAKHASESPVPPDQLAKRVPESLSAIVLKMMAKRPENRYKDIASVIAALEEFLGIDGSQPVHAREDHIHILEDCVATYHDAPLAGMRPKLIGVFLGALFVLIAAAAFGFSVMTVAAYFAISGVLDRTVLFRKARLWAWHSGWRDWIKGIVAVILIVTILFVLDWLWVWLAFAVLAIAAAVAFHWMVDRPLARAQSGSLERTRMLLRQMRSRGMDENAIHHFVCKYAGDRWEGFYEALFGYEAKIDARLRWGSDERGRPRPRFRGWRDGVIAWVDRQEAERREAATRRVLQVVETKGLEASGVDAMHARQKAKRRAEAMVAKAAELRHSPSRAASEATDAASLNFDKLFDAGGEPKHVSRHHEAYLSRRYGGPAEWIIGPPMRFAAAIVLLACFTLWLYQNKQVAQRGFANLWSASRVEPPTSGKQVMDRAIEIRNYGDEVSRSARELSIPLVPQAVTQRLGGFHTAVAGLILLALSFFRGVILSLLGWLAAAIAVIGHEFTAGAGGLGAEMFAFAIAVALTFIAFIFFRQPAD